MATPGDLPPPPRPYPFASRNERAWVPPPAPHHSMEVHPPTSSDKSRLFSTSAGTTATPHADATTQAMRNDLEGLIEYIDGLAFQLSPEQSQQQQHQINENYQGLDLRSSTISPLRSKHDHNRSKPVFRDRSNDKNGRTAATTATSTKSDTYCNTSTDLPDLTILRKNHDGDPNDNRTGNRNRPTTQALPPRQDRQVLHHQQYRSLVLDPVGNSPTNDSSLYLQDESLSLILSRSSVDGDNDNNEQVPRYRSASAALPNHPAPRILAQVEGRLSRLGTSMTSPYHNHFGLRAGTLETVTTKNISQYQPPGAAYLTHSSNVEPLMEHNRVTTSTIKPSAMRFVESTSLDPVPDSAQDGYHQRQHSNTNTRRTNSISRDPTPVKHFKNPPSTSRDTNVGFLQPDFSTPNNNAHRLDNDLGMFAVKTTMSVDATPRLNGKASRRLIPTEDPDGHDGDFPWNTDDGATPLDINDSTTSSSSSDIKNPAFHNDKLKGNDHTTSQSDLDTFHNFKTPVQRVQASIPGVSPPESARALLKDAIQAVQEARTERQSARIWADEVKDEVIRWVSEQRELIRSESLATNSPTSAATTVSCLMQLEQTIQNLHHDLARSSSSREDSDRKLEQLLLDQAEQIRSMSSQLDVLKEKLNTVAGARSESTINANAAKNLDAVDGTTTPVFYSSSTGDVPRFIERPGKGNTVSRSILSATTYSSSNSQRNRRKTHNGGYITEYSNGSVKEVHPDGTTVTRFPNGDVETKFRCLSPARKASTPSSISAQASPPGIVAYFYSKDSILQISQRDGSKLFEYPNGQVEKHYPDGFKMILFSDGTKQGVTKDGRVIEYSK